MFLNKAVQTGGLSGGCIPASAFDGLVDYESRTLRDFQDEYLA
jgi:NADH:ubiquinone oxidoreductase subunit F (NADH-binding)